MHKKHKTQAPVTPEINEEDREIFLSAIEGVTLLVTERKVNYEPPKPSARPKQRERDEQDAIYEALNGPLDIDDLLLIGDTFLQTGLPRTILRDLRKGRWSIQGHTDLHGMNRLEAHEAVSRLLGEARASGKRCLRIIHGRGKGSPGREGVLKQLVKTWLSRNKNVLAFCHAPYCDGGEGALWVLIRADRARLK